MIPSAIILGASFIPLAKLVAATLDQCATPSSMPGFLAASGLGVAGPCLSLCAVYPRRNAAKGPAASGRKTRMMILVQARLWRPKR